MVGPERFELSTSTPPVWRANQAALRSDERAAHPTGVQLVDNLFRYHFAFSTMVVKSSL